jgi:hypothetical protein
MNKTRVEELIFQKYRKMPGFWGHYGDPDLDYCMQVLGEAADRRHFDLLALARVEWAWNAEYHDVGMFGWIIGLRTGQRFYLEMALTDEGDGSATADLEITPLAPQQLFPDELEDAVRWYRPDHINLHLGLPNYDA